MTAPVPPRGLLPLRGSVGVGTVDGPSAQLPAAGAPARPGRGYLPPLDTPDDRDRQRRTAPPGRLPVAHVLALLALLGLALLVGVKAGGGSETRADAAARAGAGSSTGQLRIADTDVLSDPAALGRIGSLVGQVAVGRGVLVQEVVSDEGFWVGASSDERVFVHLTEAVRGGAESPFRVRAGERIDVNGTVSRPAAGAGALGVTGAKGADQLEGQAAYVAASAVRLAS